MARARAWNRRALQTRMVYFGGLIGPFASQSLVAVVPEFADTFSKPVQHASFAVTAYMITLASTMLFSSALVRNVAPQIVVRTAYAFTAAGAAICWVAPSWNWFIAGIVVMAFSNAFTLPILQLMLRQLVPPEELGQALGRYFAMQSLGNCVGPLGAGVVSIANWQLIHLLVIALAAAMVLVGVPPVEPVRREKVDEPIAWPPMIVHIFTILALGAGIIGMGTVITIHLDSAFGMAASQRGLVIMVGGLVAFFVSPRIGSSVDKFGALTIMTVCAVAGAGTIAAIPHLPWPVAIAACWAVAISCAQGIQTTVTYSVLRTPGGAALNSSILAFRFFGLALTPLMLLPVYLRSAWAGFAVPAVLLMAALGLQWAQPAMRATRRPAFRAA